MSSDMSVILCTGKSQVPPVTSGSFRIVYFALTTHTDAYQLAMIIPFGILHPTIAILMRIPP